MFCRECGNHVSKSNWSERFRKCLDCLVDTDRGGRYDND